MAWRKFENHKEETKAVKAALVKAGYQGVKVGHGTGTAWGWLRVTVTIQHADPCGCIREPHGTITRGYGCATKWRDTYADLMKLCQEVTGRHGEYNGDINAEINFDTAQEAQLVPLQEVTIIDYAR